LRYPELVDESISLYVAHLERTHESLSPGGNFATRCLIDTLEAARLKGQRMDPTEATATWRQMAAASVDDAGVLLNQWQLGYGRDDAPVISIGTEHAYELRPLDRQGEYCAHYDDERPHCSCGLRPPASRSARQFGGQTQLLEDARDWKGY
jgi:hypothetical protein